MIDRYLITLIYSLLLVLMGCKFKSSPYVSRTPSTLRNESNLKAIKDQELATGSDFKVALISDTHNYYDELNQLVKAINRNGPYAFVIVTGDISNYGLLEEYQETSYYLDQLNSPSMVVVGNHDLLSKGNVIYKRMFGESNLSFVYKNAHFIFFNNNNWETAGMVPDKPFVESALMTSASPIKLLLAHVAPDDRDRFSDSAIAEWEALLTTYAVDYFINGHNHNPTEGVYGGATQLTVGAPTKGSYYELLITAGGVTHQKISF